LPLLRKKPGAAGAMRVPGGTLLAILGVLICAGMLTRIEYNKSLILLAAVGVALLNWLAVRRRGKIHHNQSSV